MYPLCRHLKSNGKYCQSPALKGHLRCFHHQQIKIRVRQRTSACDFTLPLVYPEDRAAVQLNLHLIAQAVLYGRMEPRTAHALTNTYRACMANLRHGPLIEADTENTVERVILTPEGEEIAPPRERLEEDEELTHGHDCPCRKCAEQHRGAAPEQHHAHCKCGLCGAKTETAVTEATQDAEMKITEAEAAQATETQAAETQAEKTQAAQGAETQAAEMKAAVRVADAQKLYAKEPEKMRDDESASDESPYKRIIREYEARQAAIEAGLIERPAPKPIDPNGPYAQGKRKDEEINAQIERNKQAGHELWLKRFAHLQQNYEPMHPQQQPSTNINR